MHPDFAGLPSYGLFAVTGMLLWWWLSRRQAKAMGIAPSHVDLLCPIIVLAGALATRLWALVGDPASAERLRLLAWVLVGCITLAIYARVARLPARRFADAFAGPLALGLAWGRIGCFLAGCCWGDVCADPRQVTAAVAPDVAARVQTWPRLSPPSFPLAVRFPDGSWAHRQHSELGLIPTDSGEALPVHPVQLYEAALLAALGLGLLHRARRPGARHPGEQVVLALGAYGAIRFVMEGLRADNPLFAGGMTLTQWICVALVMASLGITLNWHLRSRSRNRGAQVKNPESTSMKVAG